MSLQNIKMYDKNHALIPFIGPKGLEKLKLSKVVLIGLGGLGSPCAISLAGCSIGELVCIDFDIVSESNLHRQTLYDFTHIGKKKCSIAQNRLEKLNPNIKITCIDTLITAQNILDLIDRADVVIDATDNFETRYVINDACILSKKALVYGAIHQTEGHVTVFNYKNAGATLRCLFTENDAQNAIQDCNIIGAYNIVTQTIGTFMANEAVKIILEHETVLAGKLLTFNALNYATQIFGYLENTENRKQNSNHFKGHSVAKNIIWSQEELDALLKQNAILVDVRTPEEHSMKNIGGKNLPYKEMYFETNSNFFSKINSETPIIVYCQSGARSNLAQKNLKAHGLKVFDIVGGLNRFLLKHFVIFLSFFCVFCG